MCHEQEREPLPAGLYDHVMSRALQERIDQTGDPRLADLADLDPEDAHTVMAQFIEHLLAASLSAMRGRDAAA